ncbi:MAG: metallophosphoesterase, partial [Proteobacteria bacterium]|nr:metallophosphoesterase [Pseudomonadota bacterium]
KKCENNSIWGCQKDNEGCYDWMEELACTGNTTCDPSSYTCVDQGGEPIPCTDACSENAQKCESNGVWTCRKNLEGCLAWSEDDVCSDETHCDASSYTCVSNDPGQCTDQCTENAQKCESNAVWTCQKNGSGCTEWIETLACQSGTNCDASSYTCKAGCNEICETNNKKRCSGDRLEQCETDENGCASWSLLEECEGACDAQKLACPAEQCVSECTIGEKACSGTSGYKTCVDSNSDGCGEWSAVQACGSGKECKSNPVECVAACTSECKSGAEQVLATSYRVCEDSNGHGCYKWKDKVTCKKGQYLDSGSKTCKAVCGSKCETFSIVFLPDTQEYTRPANKGGILKQDLQWIVDNKSKYNIKAVMHLGDMTDTNTEEAWGFNNTIYAATLDKSGIPYLTGTGNHDYLKCASNSSAVDSCTYGRGNTNISKYGKFNNSRFSGKSWFGTYKYTGNSYITIKASGIKLLLMSLEFAPRKDTICWAESVIKSHSDHKVIITTHAYLNSKADEVSPNSSGKYTSGYAAGSKTGGLSTGASGSELLKELSMRHNNIILIANGHINASTFRINKGNADNWFNEMIVDYQEENIGDGKCEHTHSYGGGGGGWMRILTFDPSKYTITSKSVTPVAASKFKGGKQKFFCTSAYPAQADANSSTKLSSGGKRMTTNHAFIVDYDFVTPVDYKVTDGNTGFTHRNINSISDGNQNNPAVAMSRESRNFVAVWADDAYNDDGKDTDGANNQDIRARIFCETGCNKVSQFTVNTTTSGNQKNPDVAMDINGNSVFVWTNASDNSVYMRKFNLKGTALTKETKVNTSGKADMAKVGIADDGSYVVTWQNGTDIYMRGFDASGNQTFGQTKVSKAELQTNGKRNLPVIGMAADGTYVIAWEDDVDGNGWYEIRGRGFNKNGSERLKQFVVNTVNDGQQRRPAIGMSSTGDFAIAWEDDTDKNDVYRIRMHSFKKDGTDVKKDAFVSKAGESATRPTVCMQKNGTAHFGWQAKKYVTDDATYTNVNVRSSSSDLSSEGLVSPITSGIQDQPDVACADNGRRVYLWHDDLDGNGKYEVMGKGF